MLKVCLLAGGMGTRLMEETVVRPKPMVEIGGRPILWHIMKIYAAHGFNEFVIALGYKGELIREFFLHYHQLNDDLTVSLKDGDVKVHRSDCEDWTVHCIDTGTETGTGGRLKRLASWLGKETFMTTYGDGVCDADLNKVLAFHRQHGRLATVLAVRPPVRFGSLRIEDGQVLSFAEKPVAAEGWINGGFFVLEPGVLDLVAGDDVMFEQGPLMTLARNGQLMAYCHEGFWQCMDTLRDVRHLESLWKERRAPWKVWK
jgi:glucose-1-phosphate cytidylyltransferase